MKQAWDELQSIREAIESCSKTGAGNQSGYQGVREYNDNGRPRLELQDGTTVETASSPADIVGKRYNLILTQRVKNKDLRYLKQALEHNADLKIYPIDPIEYFLFKYCMKGIGRLDRWRPVRRLTSRVRVFPSPRVFQ
jgi:hypothetical protein